jgi:hypothetical protein
MKLKKSTSALVAVNLFSATILAATAIGAPAWAWVSFGAHVAMTLLWTGVWIGEADSEP